MTNNIDIEAINQIALRAGKAIMEVYGDPQTPEFKTDGSPLTVADKLSHKVITEGLKSLTPEIPIISEEGEQVPYETRKDWKYFWLVDPLDGTKEFLKRNGEFTVNIGLIESGAPVLGIIYAPALGVLYFASKGNGAFKKIANEPPVAIYVDSSRESSFTVAKSRSHSSAEEEEFLSRFDIENVISVGSSLKFCMVAEGKAHIYYRHGPTMEWDTAAGQAILEAAGGSVKGQDLEEGLCYNKTSLRNESFGVLASPWLFSVTSDNRVSVIRK